MPIFSFQCSECDTEFNVFVHKGVPDQPPCTSCKSTRVERRYKPLKVVIDGIHPVYGSQMHEQPFHDAATGRDFSGKVEQKRYYEQEGIHFLEKGEK